jgi:hypothetical protein
MPLRGGSAEASQGLVSVLHTPREVHESSRIPDPSVQQSGATEGEVGEGYELLLSET